ncbi:MAG: YraN family protein [bacterium]
MSKGKFFEDLAVEFLKSKGYKIISTNFRSPFGEIDIIAMKNNCLIAFEIKGGKNPFERINPHKIQKITQTLEYFIQNQKPKFKTLQIDAIFVYHKSNEELAFEHVENITV